MNSTVPAPEEKTLVPGWSRPCWLLRSVFQLFRDDVAAKIVD